MNNFIFDIEYEKYAKAEEREREREGKAERPEVARRGNLRCATLTQVMTMFMIQFNSLNRQCVSRLDTTIYTVLSRTKS